MSFIVAIVKKESADVLHIGEFESKDEATACAKRVIDSFLLREYHIGMTSKKLFAHYSNNGEHPCIFRDGDDTLTTPGFNHMNYAMAHCDEVCSKKDA